MNLNETEKIRSIIDNYKSIHQDLNYYEKKLDNISNGIEEKSENVIRQIGDKIKECILNLQQERKNEKDFFFFIQEKYGPGEFDIETFEYKVKK